MPMKYQPNAMQCAMLTVLLVTEYEKEKEKTTTRARISHITLRTISARTRLRASFLDEWIDALAELGWSAFPVGDHFAIIKTDTTEKWVRIASKRIRPTLKRVYSGDTAVFDELEMLGEAMEEPDWLE